MIRGFDNSSKEIEAWIDKYSIDFPKQQALFDDEIYRMVKVGVALRDVNICGLTSTIVKQEILPMCRDWFRNIMIEAGICITYSDEFNKSYGVEWVFNYNNIAGDTKRSRKRLKDWICTDFLEEFKYANEAADDADDDADIVDDNHKEKQPRCSKRLTAKKETKNAASRTSQILKKGKKRRVVEDQGENFVRNISGLFGFDI